MTRAFFFDVLADHIIGSVASSIVQYTKTDKISEDDMIDAKSIVESWLDAHYEFFASVVDLVFKCILEHQPESEISRWDFMGEPGADW